MKPGNDVGSCAPDPSLATVNVGEKTTWKFTRGSAVATTDLIKATFTWNFEGGTPSTATATGASGLSQSVSYAASGSHGATVTVTLGASSYPVTCSPVQVNGAAITGCKCSTSATSVDYTATPDVAWAVTGCTTGAGLTLSYEWDGAPGTEAYVKTFTAANPGYVPKLVVKNDDNTMIEVKTCPAVKITDGPEFEITTTQAAGAIKLPKGTSSVVLSTDAYNNTVFCNVNRDDSPSGALNGTVNKTAIKGSDYIAVSMPAGTLANNGGKGGLFITGPAPRARRSAFRSGLAPAVRSAAFPLSHTVPPHRRWIPARRDRTLRKVGRPRAYRADPPRSRRSRP